jgi:hypothetical protein
MPVLGMIGAPASGLSGFCKCKPKRRQIIWPFVFHLSNTISTHSIRMDLQTLLPISRPYVFAVAVRNKACSPAWESQATFQKQGIESTITEQGLTHQMQCPAEDNSRHVPPSHPLGKMPVAGKRDEWWVLLWGTSRSEAEAGAVRSCQGISSGAAGPPGLGNTTGRIARARRVLPEESSCRLECPVKEARVDTQVRMAGLLARPLL